jgi:hypothetical protein
MERLKKKDSFENMGEFDVLMHVPPGCYYYVGSMYLTYLSIYLFYLLIQDISGLLFMFWHVGSSHHQALF